MNMTFWLIIGGVVFLFGLIQWARSGALFLDILHLTKHKDQPSEDAAQTLMDKKEMAREKESLKKSVQNMEKVMDNLLKSSFMVMAILGLCVWFVVVAVVVMDMMDFDWQDRLGFLSTNRSHRALGSPTTRAGFNSGTRSTTGGNRSRTDTIRQLGSGMRR